ncbi:leukotriene B4 receptor 1-like [Engraulis encrasicolus]|uniref:leukotriene B4 receptor 1-like n=1 Tax=Engraulis encrasicolus TaxID=184585 RepID=UPI002FD52643
MELFNVSDTTSNSSMAHHVGSGMMALCFCLGVPGNIVVMVVILRSFKEDNFALRLMLNLALSDVLCLSTVPVWIYEILHGWAFSRDLCMAVNYIVFSCLFASVLTVSLMSLHRYLLVLHRRHWERLGRRGERALMLGLWLYALVLAAPDVALFDIVKYNSRQVCVQVTESHGEKVIVLTCETLLGFAVPFGVIVVSYYHLHNQVIQSVYFRSPKLTRTVTLIVVTFVVSWAPLQVMNILEISSPQTYTGGKQRYVYMTQRVVGISLVFLNSCLNPFLYAMGFQGLCGGQCRIQSKEGTLSGEADD